MRYDRLGFPIPAEFDPPPRPAADEPRDGTSPPRRQPGTTPPGGADGRRRPGAWKRRILLLVLLGGVIPAVAGPTVWPLVREAVVLWSLERATEREAAGDVAGAASDLGRALAWHGDDVDLRCMRAVLRLENRDARGALEDASQAVALAPTAAGPWRVRGLVHVVLEDADAALADAERVVSVSAAGDPEALNHRAYIRAIVGRDLEAALADIDRALGALPEPPPEMLDTRGFLLHLLGRHRDALDQLNLAIDGMRKSRRKVAAFAGRVEPARLACRLRALDHGLAVMLQHRGLACRAIGLEEQARQDVSQAEQLGFDPTRGIF